MTQSEPRVIDAGDMPAFTGSDNDGSILVEDMPTVAELMPTSTATPKQMHRQLLTNAQEHAQQAAEDAYTACDWLSLLDQATADRYRKSARHLYELSEHVAALIEEL